MGLYKLVAVGKNALELNIIDGSPDLLLWQDRPIHLGRGVRIGEGYKFPNEWNSLSSRHCTLQYQGPEGQWLVKDTSTNGTYINGGKIGKGKEGVLKLGDTLGLSVVCPPGGQQATYHNTVEYRLDFDPDASRAPAPGVSSTANAAVARDQAQKRRLDSVSPSAQAAHTSVNGTAYKRMRSEEPEGPELNKLRSRNKELLSKLEERRDEVERLEGELAQVGDRHSKDLQQLEEKHHTELAAAERTAADALEAERARCTELQSKLAELTASSAEQQRSLKAQLTEAGQQLAAKSEEAASLGVQLQQAHEGLASRDADIARLQGEVSQEHQTVTELRLQLEQHADAAAALLEIQKQLQAKTETLSNTHKQLREEQRGRAAAEAAVKQAERALERAKTSLQDKLESERENLLVYGRSVHEVHALVSERVRAQQEEEERHQRAALQINAELKGLLEKVVAEHDRHARAASGLVQGVEEGLAQITAAGEEAGLAAAAGLQVEGAGQCMDMEDRAGQEFGQAQPQDAPMTQPLGPPPSSTSTNPTPHHSQTGALGDAAETPAATQDASGTAGLAGAGTTTAAMPGTLQPPGPFAYGTEAADLAGQTQEVFQATIAFPVSTLAVTGPTPAFVGTPLGPGSAAPAPTPATAAAVTAAATAAAAAAGSDGRQWGSGVAQRLDGSAFGMGPAAMQQRLEARLQEALGDRFEEAAGDEDMQDGVQQDPEAEAADGATPNALDVPAAELDDAAMVQDSPMTAAGEEQQQEEEQQQQAADEQEVAETQQEQGTQPEQQQEEEDFEQEQGGTVPSPLKQQQTRAGEGEGGEDAADAAAAEAAAVIVEGTEEHIDGAEGEGGDVGGVAGGANGIESGDGEEEEEGEELGVTSDDHGSSRKGSVLQGQQQQQNSQLSGSQQQRRQQQGGEEGSQGQEWQGAHVYPSSFPQQQKHVPKSLLGSSGSPAMRPHSQPMSEIDINKQQVQAQQQQQPQHDPYEFTD